MDEILFCDNIACAAYTSTFFDEDPNSSVVRCPLCGEALSVIDEDALAELVAAYTQQQMTEADSANS